MKHQRCSTLSRVFNIKEVDIKFESLKLNGPEISIMLPRSLDNYDSFLLWVCWIALGLGLATIRIQANVGKPHSFEVQPFYSLV